MNQSSFSCCCSIQSERFLVGSNTAFVVITCVWTVFTSFAATLGNGLVLVSFWRTPSLLTPANVFLISLALSDIGTGLVTAPLFLVSNVAKIIGDERLFCKYTPAYVVAGFCLCGVSMYTLTGISVERHTALRVHLRYNEVVTVPRVCVVVGGFWVICLACGAAVSRAFEWIDLFSVVTIPVCFAVTAFCYFKIHRVVRRHQEQINAQIPGQVGEQQTANAGFMKKFKRSYVDMLIIYGLFLLHFTPYLIISFVILVYGETVPLHTAGGFSEALLLSNSTLNPLLYCWRSQAIRSAVKETARKLFCGKTQH